MRPLCRPRISSLVASALQARKLKKPSTTWRSHQAMGRQMQPKMMRWVMTGRPRPDRSGGKLLSTSFETVCQCIGNGLSATCIDVGGNGYGNHRYGDTCTCHTPIQMDVICFTVGTDEVSERNETGNYRNNSQEHQGQGHRQWTLVGVRHVAVAPITCRLVPALSRPKRYHNKDGTYRMLSYLQSLS